MDLLGPRTDPVLQLQWRMIVIVGIYGRWMKDRRATAQDDGGNERTQVFAIDMRGDRHVRVVLGQRSLMSN